ncbi:uncharacterized protein EV422DRAFT_572601 [Fimicolochytrium jonesii]|uniref:uncharacterized protein n=1 Tax=Fimicolochytrium jonesii TaxID=1396493 RepID=UPI0022FDEED9|nr:uncharacterized protein EV422DRAFT_572601 [Fimicolochytrium jonesii]KAI8815611.1 hypothetical protein EV422DRAFT_572601 [Fimicolochytrium jonesii]
MDPYLYAVTARRADSVSHVLKGNITGPTDVNVVVSKFTHIEIYILEPVGDEYEPLHCPNPAVTQLLPLFGHFLLNILNDNKQAQEMLGHADELEEENAQGGREDATGYGGDEQYENGGREPSATDPYAPDNALITISGDPQTLGQVLNINNHALKLFGLRKPDVLHKNIITIIPSPFAEIHDQLLQRYLDTGYAKVIDRPRQVLRLHSSGYIMPVSLPVSKGVWGSVGRVILLIFTAKPLEFCIQLTLVDFVEVDAHTMRVIHCRKVRLTSPFSSPHIEGWNNDAPRRSNRVCLSRQPELVGSITKAQL